MFNEFFTRVYLRLVYDNTCTEPHTNLNPIPCQQASFFKTLSTETTMGNNIRDWDNYARVSVNTSTRETLVLWQLNTGKRDPFTYLLMPFRSLGA